MAEDKLFYVGQKAFIEKDGEVLVLMDFEKGIDFPGGKIQEGEMNFEKSLQREIDEETTLRVRVETPFVTWFNEKANVYLIGFVCTYVSGEISSTHKHPKHYWVNKDTFKKLDDGSTYFKALEKYFER